MDQYDSQNPPHGQRPAESDTPIYDRLFAEWQAANSSRRPVPAAPRVPAARNHRKSPEQ
ncbi:hypothetical protein [Streptomyces sp. NPDC001770]